MKSQEIREKFLKYFEGQGHKRLPGSSLIPADPTVLLTLAGMLQFKPIFLGIEKPQYKRATTVQRCVRMNDIENVGQTLRHQTFFEMLGNFSFGDYFKREAIFFAWDFLTKELNVPAARLSVAVFEKDDEAYEIWAKEMGLPKDKIFRLDEENNFWAVGATGPCGPCSEIYYDIGPDKGCGKPSCQPGCDCDRFLEVWNLVFIQYDRHESGELVPLKQKGIDTGMGLERIASVLQGVDSNFETDLFMPLIDKIKLLVKIPAPDQAKLRVIADHIRAITHLIADGVLPGNAGREYVLRRLIRRALRVGKVLGIEKAFLFELAQLVIKEMGDFYPNLKQRQEIIIKVLKLEEENFLQTLIQGIELFNKVVAEHARDKEIPGDLIFKLHDTYGFPYELSLEMAVELGYTINKEEFNQEMEKQRKLARTAGMGDDNKKGKIAKVDFGQTQFEGYKKLSSSAKIKAIIPEDKLVILDKTPFYAESGGQVGDKGIICFGDKKVCVVDTQVSPAGTVVHVVENPAGLKEKQTVTLSVDQDKRLATAAHHSATHLLHRALREVLGEQVKQAGSYVGPDKLRFDFNNPLALTHEQIMRVEDLVNQKIKEKLKVEVFEKNYQDALKMGATALFGEKYGDKVRVLKIGDYSMELCGGTHVNSTGDIKFFKIISESALGSGVRRIEAAAGTAAKNYIVFQAKKLHDEIRRLLARYKGLEHEKEALGKKKFTETNIFEVEVTEINQIARAVDDQDINNVRKFFEHLNGRLDWLKERVSKAEKELADLKHSAAAADTAEISSEAIEIKGVKVLLKSFAGYEMGQLRTISDKVFNQLKSCVVVFVSSLPGKVVFLIRVSDDLIAQGYSAKKLADILAPIVGGRAGGRDDKVEGGGKDPNKINEALDKVAGWLGGLGDG